MKIQEILTTNELELSFSVIKELRPHLSYEEFLSLYQDAKNRDDYRWVGCFQDGRYLAVMGYRVLFDFVHGKHLYIDDLVVMASFRSQGIGQKLLNFVENEAKRLGCAILRLCTGVDNTRGMRFYERNAWESRAIVYKKKLNP